MLQTILNDPSWRYALLGLVPILLYLLVSGKAKLHQVDPGSGHAGCPDKDVTKDILVFGGASAFTFGSYYFVIAWYLYHLGHPLANLFLVYGNLRLVMSGIQTITFLAQIPRSKEEVVLLKSHLERCGYTLAWGVFWPLFWIQEIPGLGWVWILSDVVTIVDFIASLPAVAVMSIISKVVFGKWIVPTIRRVDHPRKKKKKTD